MSDGYKINHNNMYVYIYMDIYIYIYAHMVVYIYTSTNYTYFVPACALVPWVGVHIEWIRPLCINEDIFRSDLYDQFDKDLERYRKHIANLQDPVNTILLYNSKMFWDVHGCNKGSTWLHPSQNFPPGSLWKCRSSQGFRCRPPCSRSLTMVPMDMRQELPFMIWIYYSNGPNGTTKRFQFWFGRLRNL